MNTIDNHSTLDMEYFNSLSSFHSIQTWKVNIFSSNIPIIQKEKQKYVRDCRMH